ncbi:hypothetical protein JCM1841_001346 [Sporobolomyces salmonicolor]
MELLDLPSELISHICAHLSPHDLSLTSLASSILRSVVQPILYAHVTLSYALYTEQADEVLERVQRDRTRTVLERLAGDPERCQLVRSLVCWNYGRWFGADESRWLERIVRQTRLLEHVQLLQDDDGAPFDEALTPLANFSPVCTALKSLPHLTTLRTQYGPNTFLHLDAFPSLVELSMAMYFVDAQNDGTLPSGLRKIRLEYVTAFDEGWFRPELFETLEELEIIELPSASLAVVQRSLTAFASHPSSSSPLRHLSLNLSSRQTRFTNLYLLLSFLASFSLLNSITDLTLLSTPGTQLAFPGMQLSSTYEAWGEPMEIVEAIARDFRGVERLRLGFGPMEEMLKEDRTEWVAQSEEHLHLTHLEINFIHTPPTSLPMPPPTLLVYCSADHVPAEHLDEVMRVYFEGMPKLQELKLAASALSPGGLFARGLLFLLFSTEPPRWLVARPPSRRRDQEALVHPQRCSRPKRNEIDMQVEHDRAAAGTGSWAPFRQVCGKGFLLHRMIILTSRFVWRNGTG